MQYKSVRKECPVKALKHTKMILIEQANGSIIWCCKFLLLVARCPLTSLLVKRLVRLVGFSHFTFSLATYQPFPSEIGFTEFVFRRKHILEKEEAFQKVHTISASPIAALDCFIGIIFFFYCNTRCENPNFLFRP